MPVLNETEPNQIGFDAKFASVLNDQACQRRAGLLMVCVNLAIIVYNWWTSQIGAKSVFLNISRDILKNTLIAPLREVHWEQWLSCGF